MSSDGFWKDPEEVSNDFKVCHSELIMYCAQLEIALGDLIQWALRIENQDVSREISGRLSGAQKAVLASGILNQLEDHLPANEFEKVHKIYQEIAAFRNQLVHGWWMDFGDNAFALTPKPRKRGQPGAALEGGIFSLENLKKTKREAKECRDRIYLLMNSDAPAIRPPSRD